VIRLRRPLTVDELDRLNTRFAALFLRDGEITQASVLDEERGELPDFSRLVMNFNRRSFGYLRQFIDALNQFDSPDSQPPERG
jgi:hypothetical protein